MSTKTFHVYQFLRTLPKTAGNTISVNINGANINTLKDLYECLKDPLILPGYFGGNLDALYDVLSDLAWLRERPVQIIIYDFDDFLDGETTEKKIQALFALVDAGQSWLDLKEDDTYFNIYIQKANTLDEILEICEIPFENLG